MDLGEQVYRLKEQLAAEGRRGLIAFDIDDTLSHTSRAFYQKLDGLFPSPSHVTFEATRKHYALTGKVLYWGDILEAKEHAYSLVDSSEFHSEMDAIEEAIPIMQKIHERNLLGCYHTARLETMQSMTRDWLDDRSFPQSPLITRPKHVSHSLQAQWKAEVIIYLFPEVAFLVDNDTRIARQLENNRYQGRVLIIGLNERDYTPTEVTTPVETFVDLGKIFDTFPEQ